MRGLGLALLMPALLAAAPALAGASPATARAASMIGAALNVVDLQREVRFYTEAIGMRVATTREMGAISETILMFDADTSKAAILLMHDRSRTAPRRRSHGNAFSRLVIRTGDLDAIAARLDALGYPHSAIRDVGQGYRVIDTTDPEGFRLEIVQGPTAR